MFPTCVNAGVDPAGITKLMPILPIPLVDAAPPGTAGVEERSGRLARGRHSFRRDAAGELDPNQRFEVIVKDENDRRIVELSLKATLNP